MRAPVAAAVLGLLLVACAPEDDAAVEPTPEVTPDEPTPTEPTPTDPTMEEPSPTPEEPAAVVDAECTNPEGGYTVAYPTDWVTNEEQLDELPPCSLFDAEDIHVEGQEVPLDTGAFLRVEAVPFAEAGAAGRFEDELDREETTIDGRDAVRLETESTGEGMIPEGTRSTRWAVDLDGETFLASTHDIGEPAYEDKQAVVDAMVAELAFDG